MLLLSVAASSALGSAAIAPGEAWRILIYQIPFLGPRLVEANWAPLNQTILLKIRLPRIIIGCLVGSALSVAGAAYQGLLRNPLADPYVLGVSSGAALGAALAIVLSGSMALVPLSAFVGALLAISLVYRLGRINGRAGLETLILAGVVVGAFFNSLLSFLLTRSYDNLEQVIFWLMGSLSLRGWDQVVYLAPLLAALIFLLWSFSRELNVLALGEETAVYLGIPVEIVKIILLAAASLLAATAVAMAGTVGFVGLVIPHIMRIILGPDYRVLIPASALAGAVFILWMDTLARVVIAPAELPLGVLTAFFGAPFFAYLLRSRHRNS